MGPVQSNSFLYILLPAISVCSPENKETCPALFVMNERKKKYARKSFVPSSSSVLSMKPWLNSVCSVLRGQFIYPCRACFASKHCKVQVGLRKKVRKVIGFDERRRKKHHLLCPADEDVSGFSCCFLHTHGH